MILQSALSEGTQSPVFRVRPNLVVPGLGVELSEPVAKGLQLVLAEAFHLSLYVLDSAHLRLHSQNTPVTRYFPALTKNTATSASRFGISVTLRCPARK